MQRIISSVIALSISLAFGASAIAQGMSKIDHQAATDRISAEHRSAKAGCASLSGNANDVCVAQADGRAKVATAELDASINQNAKTRYQARLAKAEADYAVAKQRCGDMAGNTKDVCVKEAQAAETTAKADAVAQMKTTNANDSASEKSTAARNEAAAEKLDAQYGVAKEKCDVYAGGAKEQCLDQAKARFGKS